MKPNKEIIVEHIVKLLEEGKATEKICAAICTKFQFTERTFYNHFKKANEQHTTKQEAIKKELAELDIQNAIASRKKAIMSANERKEFLSALIGKPTKLMKVAGSMVMVHQYHGEDGEILHEILPMDVKLKAMAELNKMDGAYAPEKRDHTSGGEKLGGTPNLTDTQFSKLLDVIESKSNTG